MIHPALEHQAFIFLRVLRSEFYYRFLRFIDATDRQYRSIGGTIRLSVNVVAEKRGQIARTFSFARIQ